MDMISCNFDIKLDLRPIEEVITVLFACFSLFFFFLAYINYSRVSCCIFLGGFDTAQAAARYIDLVI